MPWVFWEYWSFLNSYYFKTTQNPKLLEKKQVWVWKHLVTVVACRAFRMVSFTYQPQNHNSSKQLFNSSLSETIFLTVLSQTGMRFFLKRVSRTSHDKICFAIQDTFHIGSRQFDIQTDFSHLQKLDCPAKWIVRRAMSNGTQLFNLMDFRSI